MKALLIERASRFSPNSVEKDKAILDSVANGLMQKGMNVVVDSEDNCNWHELEQCRFDVVVNMTRSREALESLRRMEHNGARVINTSEAIANCRRSSLFALLRKNNISVPPTEGSKGFWLKRGDEAAQNIGDVVYCKDKTELQTALNKFADRGIGETEIQAHIEGDLVKFYGVNDTSFFRIYYPSDDGISKFGDENRNGKAHHYSFDKEKLQQISRAICSLTGIEVYGGDAIITANGGMSIIDFNDFPSFSRCREEAAEAIVSIIYNV